MDIKQVLQLLRHVKGPNANGEYVAECPCHADGTPSLTIGQKVSAKDGKERIYLCCQASVKGGPESCTTQSICDALGITMRDLIVNPDEPRKPSGAPAGMTVRKANPAANRPAVQQGPAKQRDPAKTRKESENEKDDEPETPIDFGHPDEVYSYTDANGNELFQVLRYEYTTRAGKRKKTFRQRRYAPDDLKAKYGGWVYSVPNDIRDNTLYHLPRLMDAIREQRPVYIVEGEKDVHTMERLGHIATCNPGGAGKWRAGYTQLLKGADAIILPDCDTEENGYTGQVHAWNIAVELKQVAQRVRLVDIKAACPDVPPKGDISDVVAILGDVGGMDALARQVAATKDFDPDDVPFWADPMQQAEMLYSKVQGYGVVGGCISQMVADGSKALADFVVIPRMELIRDDGVNQSMYFVLDGWASSGRPLGRVTISSKELDAMNWVTAKWGYAACLAPGTATKDKAAWAIKKVGQLTAKRVTEYSHTGWRKIGGKWVYLYHGGAVGMEGISVDMGDALKTYRLDGSGAQGYDSIPLEVAAATSMGMKDVMAEEIGTALLGTIYLAPLREFMSQTDIVPAFALFLYGESGTHKTTAAALAMSHFGNFHAKNPPASFNDTGNQIRKKAFQVKDMPLLVDDYHPTSSAQEKRQMAATAQTLSRAFGDGADRGRLNADSTIKAATPPRSVAIITGEDLPAIGASGLARYFIIDMDKGDVPITPELTCAQDMARRGYLQKAMRGYITWLQKQTSQLPERLHDLFITFREDIHKHSTGQHDRAPEAVACIMIGYAMALNYFRDVGLIDTATATAMLVRARQVLTDTSRKQAKSMEGEKPTRIFLDGLTELLASKTVGLRDISPAIDGEPAHTTGRDMVGYMDGDYYYLLPNVAFGAVSKLCREQGIEFPVSLKALYKHLRTDGILQGMARGETPTKNRWIDGKAVRLLWIPRACMDGPQAATQQTRMDMQAVEQPTDFPQEWT